MKTGSHQKVRNSSTHNRKKNIRLEKNSTCKKETGNKNRKVKVTINADLFATNVRVPKWPLEQ